MRSVNKLVRNIIALISINAPIIHFIIFEFKRMRIFFKLNHVTRGKKVLHHNSIQIELKTYIKYYSLHNNILRILSNGMLLLKVSFAMHFLVEDHLETQQ